MQLFIIAAAAALSAFSATRSILAAAKLEVMVGYGPSLPPPITEISEREPVTVLCSSAICRCVQQNAKTKAQEMFTEEFLNKTSCSDEHKRTD